MKKEAKPNKVLERRVVPQKALVMKQGDPGSCAYLIQAGLVSIYTEQNGTKVEIAQLGPGEIFGERALIFDEPRTASVKTIEDCILIIINRKSFKQKLDRSDATIKAIVNMLSRRLSTANAASSGQFDSAQDVEKSMQLIYNSYLSGIAADQKDHVQNAIGEKFTAFLELLQPFK